MFPSKKLPGSMIDKSRGLRIFPLDPYGNAGETLTMARDAEARSWRGLRVELNKLMRKSKY